MRQSILGAIALAICASHVGINDRALADEPVVSCTLMKVWPPHSAFSGVPITYCRSKRR